MTRDEVLAVLNAYTQRVCNPSRASLCTEKDARVICKTIIGECVSELKVAKNDPPFGEVLAAVKCKVTNALSTLPEGESKADLRKFLEGLEGFLSVG